METRALIIGSGNVAEAFARALPRCGVQVVQIFARNEARRRELARYAGGCPHTADPLQLADADICIVAVSDRAITQVLEPLTFADSAVVVHVSGGQPIEAIPSKTAHRGVLYPLQTFTAGRDVDFAEIPLFIEAADPYTAAKLNEFAHRLSKNVRSADSAQRALIHAAGVFACNFANAMYAAGNETARLAGMPFDILKPLIAETARKACENPDPRTVQTGPAIRGDITTMERHLAALGKHGKEQLCNIYNAISDYIATEYGKKL